MDFVSYLEDLPPSAVRELYSSPWTCRAVLRSLSPLAKQYVMRLAFLDDNLADGTLSVTVVVFRCARDAPDLIVVSLQAFCTRGLQSQVRASMLQQCASWGSYPCCSRHRSTRQL